MARRKDMRSESCMLNAMDIENQYQRLHFFSPFSEKGYERYKIYKKRRQDELNRESSVTLNTSDVAISHIGGDVHGVEGWNLEDQGDKANLWETLRNMVLNNWQPDIQVRIGKLMFNCHRMVLKSYSRFFWDRGTDSPIELPESRITVRGFLMVYDWMLADKPRLQPDGLMELFQASFYLSIDQLYEQCWTCLENDLVLREDVAFRFFHEAKQLDIKLLYEMFLTRVCKYFLPLMASDAYLQLDVDSVCLLLGSSAIGVNSEIEVLMSAIRWLNYDWKRRREHTEQVVGCVRFSLMPLGYLINLGKSLDCPQTQRVIDTDSVKGQINKSITFVAAKESRRMTPTQYAEFARTIDVQVPEKRQWLVYPKCEYHHGLRCNEFQIVSFDVFRKNLKKFAELPEAEWKQMKFITGRHQQCPNVRCYRALPVHRAPKSETEISNYSTDSTMAGSRESGRHHHDNRHSERCLRMQAALRSAHRLHKRKLLVPPPERRHHHAREPIRANVSEERTFSVRVPAQPQQSQEASSVEGIASQTEPPAERQPQQHLTQHLQQQHRSRRSQSVQPPLLRQVHRPRNQPQEQPQQFEPSWHAPQGQYEQSEGCSLSFQYPQFPNAYPGWPHPNHMYHPYYMGHPPIHPAYMQASPPMAPWNGAPCQTTPLWRPQYPNQDEMNAQQQASPTVCTPSGESLSIQTLESSQEENVGRRRSRSLQNRKMERQAIKVIYQCDRKHSGQPTQLAETPNPKDRDTTEVRLQAAVQEQASREHRPRCSNAVDERLSHKRSTSDGVRRYTALKQTGQSLAGQSGEELRQAKATLNLTQGHHEISEENREPQPSTSGQRADGGQLKRLIKPRRSPSKALSESDAHTLDDSQDELKNDLRRLLQQRKQLLRSHNQRESIMPPLYRKLSLMEIPPENSSSSASANAKESRSSHKAAEQSEEKPPEQSKSGEINAEKETDSPNKDPSTQSVVAPVKMVDIGGMTIYSFGGNDPYDQPAIFRNITCYTKALVKESDEDKKVSPRTHKFGDQVLYLRSHFDNWQHVTYIPFGMRNHYCTVQCDGKIYVIGGTRMTFDFEQHRSEKYEKTVWRYHPVTNKWTCETNLPEPRRDFAVVVLDKSYHGDREPHYRFRDKHGFFVIGGEGVHGVLDSVLFYDVTKKSWTEMASLNHPRLGSMATLQHNDIWVVGGCRYGSNTAITLISDTMESYSLMCHCQASKSEGDTSTKCNCNKWRVLETRLRIPRVFGRICTVSKYEVYLIGGMTTIKDNDWVSIGDVDVYDFLRRTWYHCADLRYERHSHDVALVDQDILVIGGISTVHKRAFSEMELLDTKRRRSTLIGPSLPLRLTGLCIVCMNFL